MARKFTLEDAKIVFRNFSGEPDRYNKKGDRNFCLILPTDVADELSAEGWNVRTLPPKDDLPATPYLRVNVSFGKYPPKIVMISHRGKAILTEESVSTLDVAEIETVDLTISPYTWSQPDGRTGVSAYLKTMYVTLREDSLSAKYDHIPDAY